MLYDLTPYSTLLLIFFSQGLVFSYHLFIKAKQENNSSSFWLGSFIVLSSIYILPWMLGYASWYRYEPYRTIMFYVPFQHLFLIGPMIYFYTQSLLNPMFRFNKRHYVHLVPGVFYVLFSGWMWIYDCFSSNTIYFYGDGRDRELDNWYQISGVLSMSYYCIQSIIIYNNYKQSIFDKVSFADSILFSWIKKYLILFLTIQILRIVFFVLFPNWGSFNQKGLYYLCFSLFFYYISLKGLLMNLKPISAYQNAINEEFKEIEQNISYQDNELLTELEYWKGKIIQFVQVDEQYKNQELTLLNIAKGLQTNTTLISNMINKGFGVNFNDFINRYRVDAFKQKVMAGEYQKSTLLGLAYDCGFNSKTTFNRSFKKATGQTPKEFLETKKNNL